MMLYSVQYLPAWKYLTAKRSISVLLFIIAIIILTPFYTATAQEMDDRKKWSIGLHAGVLSGNLPTVSATNTIVSRFNVENNYYLTAAFQAGYSISEYESLQLTLSRGEFSIFTDYEFWPDVLFKNQFYTATLSAQLDLRRFIEALPDRFDPYGSFGLGLMSSSHTVAPLNSEGTVQSEFTDDQSNNLSFLLSTGFGFDYYLNSRISLFFQFNRNFLSSDIIDKNLAGDVLNNDFIQTTSNWSTYTSGFRIKFGRSKTRTEPEPEEDDFQIVSTISADRLDAIAREESDLSDSTEEQDAEENSIKESATVEQDEENSTEESDTEEQKPEVNNTDENDTEEQKPEVNNTDENDTEEQKPEENSTESESTDVQTLIIPELPVSTVEAETSEEISDDENEMDQDVPETEIISTNDEFEDDIIFSTQQRYGLMGTAVEEIPGSFSLNLHSFSDHNEANDIIVELDALGFRVVTQIVNVNGIVYLRVGVGQFETRGEARSAAANLPERYLRNYFIIEN